MDSTAGRNWWHSIRAFLHPRVITMLFLGLSAGLPLLLIFSSLSLWLREAGVERAAVTFFSWAALGYSFKFVWAPLVDRLPLPGLTRWLGRRRSWMLLSQLAIMASICAMAFTDPSLGVTNLTLMAGAAVALGFSSATQDIVIDAYRIESADNELQALMSATYIAGYRVGTLAAGAGALFLAAYFGSSAAEYNYDAWRLAYLSMAMLMLIGVATTLIIAEPQQQPDDGLFTNTRDYLGFVSVFVFMILGFVGGFLLFGAFLSSVAGDSLLLRFALGVLRLLIAVLSAGLFGWVAVKLGLVDKRALISTYVAPVRDFFQRYGFQVALLLLALIGLYRISDIVLGVIANVFYQDMGFSKIQIASVVKGFGLAMTILGGFLGGLLTLRYGVMRVLFAGALLTVLTNLLFVALAVAGNQEWLLYVVISADNLTAGLASAAFIAFLSSLTNIRFTALQYALFSSLMTLIPKLLGGYSGSVVDSLGYVPFFVIAALLGVPVLLLIRLVARKVDLAPPEIG